VKTLLGRVCGIFCILWAAKSLFWRLFYEAEYTRPWIIDLIVLAIGIYLMRETGGMMGRVRRHRQPTKSL